ncbi:MAG: penicillin-binding protein activator [Gammaproteobacteria bacterium]|nr:penicillin-binding protein activator [Gammaproteobacteria bacterium]
MRHLQSIKKRLPSVTLFIISLTLLCSCGPSPNTYGAKNNQFPLSTDQYMQSANNSQGDNKQNFLFSAAGRSMQDQNYIRSQQIINQISPSSTQMQIQKQFLQTKLFFKTHQLAAAGTTLQSLNNISSKFNNDEQVELYTLQAKLDDAQGNIIGSINQRNQLAPLLNTQQQQQNSMTIWASLQKLSSKQLADFVKQTPSSNLQGWLSLALVTKQSQTPQTLMVALTQWRQSFPNHPANALLPNDLKERIQAPQLPQNIALLLPMTGKLSKSANAIRNGFFAAYYYQKSHSDYSPNIQVYDTTGNDINDLYQKAIQQGANFVVGPLTKPNVVQLSQNSLTAPTLVLNTPPSIANQTQKNFYTFGLSPLDEIQQVTQKAWQDRLSRAIIIAPNNDWGNTIADTLNAEWTALGGRVVTKLSFVSQQSLADQIQQTLHIDNANLDYKNLRRILGEKVRFFPRRRQDIDVVFLAAQPLFARQIKPLLNFYYAGGIPVYAISPVYSGRPNPIRNRDLNGVYFYDIPWVLQPNQLTPNYLMSIKNNIKQIWPGSYRNNSKLYALGVDAYDIISKLNQMSLLPQFGVPGATGTLFLDTQNHIYRQLVWARFKKGRPVVIEQ